MPSLCPIKKLEKYEGKLSAEEAAAGINASMKNAKRLAEDSEFLFEKGRYPSATSLAIISIEEHGKGTTLRALCVATDLKELRALWRDFRNHRAKNGMWIMPAMAANGARYLNDLKDVINKKSNHTSVINDIKNIGLYTDCYKQGHWSEPIRVIDRELSQQLVKTAKVLSSSHHTVHVREMELWVEFLSPVWNTPHMVRALIEWHAQLVEEGLNQHEHEEFKAFVLGKDQTLYRS